MDERETVRSLGWSHRSVTRRVAFGALAGGMITAAELETGQARTKKRAQAAAKPSAAAERQRPISEFVTAQGSTTQFVPPVPDVLGWATFSDDPVLFAWVDYAGVADEFLHGALGTATSGNVIEQPQKDGRAKVHVSLHTRNALAWVIELDLDDVNDDVFDQIANKKPIFGYRPQEVDAKHPASLVDATLDVVFLNTAPGAPLPDLVVATKPDVEFISQKFRSNGEGTIRDPETGKTSRGRLTVVQVGPRLDKFPDFFSAEVIKVQPVGR